MKEKVGDTVPLRRRTVHWMFKDLEAVRVTWQERVWAGRVTDMAHGEAIRVTSF